MLSPVLVPATLLASLLAREVEVVRDVTLLRWPEGDPVPTVPVPAGTRAEEVARRGELVRIRVGGDLGWVPLDAVSEVPEGAGDEEEPAAP